MVKSYLPFKHSSLCLSAFLISPSEAEEGNCSVLAMVVMRMMSATAMMRMKTMIMRRTKMIMRMTKIIMMMTKMTMRMTKMKMSMT